jgi:predicted phosphodiesterase
MAKRSYIQYEDEHLIWLDDRVKEGEGSWGAIALDFNAKFGTMQSEPTLYQTYRKAKQQGRIKSARAKAKAKLALSDKDYVKVAIIPDMHMPYHDMKAVMAVLNVVSDWKPDIFVNLGDLLDFYQISQFSRDPRQATMLGDDLYEAAEMIGNFRDAAGQECDMHWIKGNHEDRWNRHLIKNSAEFYALFEENSFMSFMDLSQHNIHFHDYDFVYRGFQFVHGDVVRKFAGYAAKEMHSRSNMDGAMGHTHRMGMFRHTYRAEKAFTFMECGHLYDKSQATYINGNPNWQQGAVMAEFWFPEPDHLEVIPHFLTTHNGMTVHNGKKYVG